MGALSVICAEAHEGERYRDRVNTFYNRLYKRANKIVKKDQPCSTTRDAEGNVVCAGCDKKAWNWDNRVEPNTLCCRGCEHHGAEGCKASLPLACRTWLCPAVASKKPETARKLAHLALGAQRVGIYGVRASKSQVMARRFQAEALVVAMLGEGQAALYCVVFGAERPS